ncbi:MAG: Stp1/IreP family PP2C-type Ser/Thr phosphatase [Blastocatellia bacterium]|nr:Stp1/IreP family PP2C-type Ser/Thr phosphatase [Blastocatellia bacterium]
MSTDNIKTYIAGLTDRGLVRKNNEDSFTIVDPMTGDFIGTVAGLDQPQKEHRLLIVVSDGMGGTEGGEVASELTVETIKSETTKLSRRLSPQSRLEAAVEEANSVVWNRQKETPALAGMGATVTAALIEAGTVYIAEVGDSRAYVIRRDRIKQITTDQTMVQALIDAGALTPETAERSPMRNMLLQAIGSEEFLQIAVCSFNLQKGDILLLCSDGLHNKLKATEIRDIILSHHDIQDASKALVEEAKRRGGDDNITVVLSRFEGDGLQDSRNLSKITDALHIISRFDPHQGATPKPKRQVRAATYDDLVATAAIDHFAQTEAQKKALMQLQDYGEYIVYRKGDALVVQGEQSDCHFWLVSGRFRVEIRKAEGRSETVTFIVPATDLRLDDEIRGTLEYVRVKRQFFTASPGMLNNTPRGATIVCEDDTNAAVRVPKPIYEKIAVILGEKFELTVRHN